MRQDARTNIAQSTAYLQVKAHVTTPASMLDAAPLVMHSIKLCKQLGKSYKKPCAAYLNLTLKNTDY